MKSLKIVFAFVIALSILSGCDSTKTNKDISGSLPTVSTDTLEEITTTSCEDERATTVDESAISEEATDNGLIEIFEPTGYNFYYVDKFCIAIQDMISAAKAEVDLYDSFVPILGIESNDDISEQFESLIKTSTSDDYMQSVEDFPDLLDKVCENLENNNGDPDFIPLMRECADSVVKYLICVYNPSGSCSDFFDDADRLFDDAVFKHDDVVEYLYSIGYYSSDEQ